MQPVPLARVSVLDPLFRYLARTGAPVSGEVVRARARLMDPLSLIPLAIGGLLFHEAALLTGLEDLGLRVGSASRPEDVGALGAFVRSAPTLGVALARAVRDGPRFNSGERYWLTWRGDDVVFHWSYARALRAGRSQVNEFVLMLWIQLVRLVAGADWRPRAIGLEGPPRSDGSLLALAEGIRFGQPETTLVIPRELLELPLPPPLPGHGSAPDSAPGAAWPRLDFPGSVRQAIAGLLRLGDADVASLASAAGTSVRSLQRRLAEAELSFSELLEEARFETAQRLLHDPSRKVIAISAELGYTDSANFTRAFRRWTGLSPRDFRRALATQRLAASP
jgi:AraC-like DNA-binding protein